MRVLFDDHAGPSLLRRFAALSAEGVEVSACPPGDTKRRSAALADAAAWWHVLTPVTAADITAAGKLRLIQKIGAGVNTIAVAEATARGIAVCNLPGRNAPAVAEHALLLMLAVLRRLPLVDAALRAGNWAVPPYLHDRFGELAGRTVGLVGYGATAQALAKLLAGFGCRLLVHTRSRRDDVPWCTLPALLDASDVVSLHLPLTEQTRHLIGAAALARMRPHAILVNTARGGLVDQAALLSALEAGRLGGAGLDVFDPEPVGADDPLLQRDDVVVTPHIAWLTPQMWGRCIDVAAENLRRLRDGAPLLHRVA